MGREEVKNVKATIECGNQYPKCDTCLTKFIATGRERSCATSVEGSVNEDLELTVRDGQKVMLYEIPSQARSQIREPSRDLKAFEARV
jgi:hypothetical protein